ncbi:hypothetical protein [Kordiimonas sp.]|uniref:hypothetical protein n=1 Tax=Kordiimonas sp. TaxID=1970157 RepID=UPI003B5212D0
MAKDSDKHDLKSNTENKDSLSSFWEFIGNTWEKIPKDLISPIAKFAGVVGGILPMILITTYSASQGLPVLDVLSTLGGHVITLFVISFIVTLFAAIIMLVPGAYRAFDERSLTKREDRDGLNDDEVALHDHYLAVSSCAPALGVMTGIVSLGPWLMSEGVSLAFAFGSAAGFAVFLFGAIYQGRRRIALIKKLKKSDIQKRAKKKDWGWLLPMIGMDIGVAMVWWSFSIGLLSDRFGEVSFDGVNSEMAVGLISFVVAVFTSCLLVLSSAWCRKISFGRVVGAVSIVMLVLVFFYPRAHGLMKNNLRMLSQGGDVYVVLVADKSVVEDWPELFQREVSPVDGSEGELKARTKPLRLSLLGSDKLFVQLPKDAPQSEAFKDAKIEIDRAKIKSIAFIGKETKKKEENVTETAANSFK